MPEISQRDRNTIAAVLRATVEGPFFPDWEFHTLFGFEREVPRRVLATWPRQIWTEHTYEVVQSSFCQLLGYPHDQWAAWTTFSDASIQELRAARRHYSAAYTALSRDRRRPV